MSTHIGGTRGAFRLEITVVAIAALTVVSGLGISHARASTEDLFSHVSTIIAPFSPYPTVKVDGEILPGEYDSTVTYTTSDTAVSVSLLHDNDSLYVGIEGPAWRWVALGISSDGGSTMGFVVVTRASSDFSVQERLVTSVAENMTFNSPHPGRGAVQEFEADFSRDIAVAEIQLNLDSSIWSLGPGIVYPTVLASNLTAPEGVPGRISENDANFVGSYLLRTGDSVKDMNDLLNGKTSPVPSVAALVVLAFGVVAIFTEFVVRRRKG